MERRRKGRREGRKRGVKKRMEGGRDGGTDRRAGGLMESPMDIERFHLLGQLLSKFFGIKKAFTYEKSSTPIGLVWMADIMSYENVLLVDRE